MNRGSIYHGHDGYGGQNNMGRRNNIPWVEGVNISWVGGGQYTMGRVVDISLVGGSIYHG